MNKGLAKPSQFDRVPRAPRGIIGLSESDKPDLQQARSNPTGGVWGAGLLPRVSLCSRGEALSHYFWVDGVMLQQIADMLNAAGRIKSRFAHPDLCADGTGKALGTIDKGVVAGDQVYGNLSFYASAHKAPDGNLAGYVMSLADEDPELFGLSIVFRHDWEAEELFEAEHTQSIEVKDESGKRIDVRQEFISPDPLNTQNLPHARILELHAADVVDDPAANPNGLFHRQTELATNGRSLLDFVLGRSETPPQLSALGIAPERLKGFINQYLADSGLTLKELAMPKPTASLTAALDKTEDMPKEGCEDQPKEGETKDGEEGKTGDDEDEPAESSTETVPAEDDKAKSDLSAFCEMFGHERGAKYFLSGKSLTDALKAEVITLRGERDEANKKLEAFATVGVDPVKFNAAPDKRPGGATAGDEPLSNRDKFAATNKETVKDPVTKTA